MNIIQYVCFLVQSIIFGVSPPNNLKYKVENCQKKTTLSCAVTKLKTRTAKMAAIAKFVIFNSLLPLFDMGTDIKAFVFYISALAYHPNWAALTLMWILGKLSKNKMYISQSG